MNPMTFQLNKNAFSELEKALDEALFDAVVDLTGNIKRHLVPRSKNQPKPKDPTIPTTGNLRDAVTWKKDWNMKYRIGVDATIPTRTFDINGKEIKRPKPVSYGEHLEFGTKYMKPRSFLRRGSIEFRKRFFQVLKVWFQRRFIKK